MLFTNTHAHMQTHVGVEPASGIRKYEREQDTGRKTPVKGHQTNKHTHIHTAFDDFHRVIFFFVAV